jgi:DNA adenine methylase
MTWVGSKKSIRNIVTAVFPRLFDRYIEPFAGGAWILYHKEPENHFEVINDYNSWLVNLYRVVKNRPMAFIRELGFLQLNSRDDFLVLKKFVDGEEFTEDFLKQELELTEIMLPAPDANVIKNMFIEKATDFDLKKAVEFFKLIRYSYSSGGKSFGSKSCDLRKVFDTLYKASNRLASVVVENKDFGAVIKQYDRENALFYCDPPYYETEGMYAVMFAKADHYRLFNALSQIKGKFLLSYNDCPFIRELYKDFSIMEFKRTHSMAQKYEAGKEFPEILIANYNLMDRANCPPMQLTLFGDYEKNYLEILKGCKLVCQTKTKS